MYPKQAETGVKWGTLPTPRRRKENTLTMRKMTAVAFLFLTCACTTADFKTFNTPQLAQPVTCVGDDCAVAWGRAMSWVQTAVPRKIVTATDTLIATDGPDGAVARVEVTKVATGNGASTIQLRTTCDNPFGCVPNTRQLQQSFADAMK
jgi:hypothetical protein